MKVFFPVVLVISLSACETMNSMQEDISDFSDSLFSSEVDENAQDAFLKAQEAFNEADKAKQSKASLNAQQRSLWIALEDNYNRLAATPSRATEQESYFSDMTLADNVMSQSLQFIELIEKSD